MNYLKRVLRFLPSLLVAILSIFACQAIAQPGSGTPSRNDHIFPAATVAKSYIDYDARGFLINGKRTFIVSAGMEYARVPRALWRDRLLKFKRAGFNAVEMYTFWNFHEEKEGQFNFTGDHDLNAFLQLIKSMDMYAIVRVGPYYCGEWNMGGYPIWLRFKPGMRVREDNPQFLSAVDKYFDKLIPIVSKNQINHGGAVIMVQLENEHRAAWGTITPNNYFKHLITKTASLGLQVPYFFSGLHPGNDPASEVQNFDDPDRPNPWFSTEYWGVWITNYGPQDQDSTIYDRRTWKIIAHGGNGYNVYMAHGGTNFDYNNDREMAASYDYGAAVGQAGDLRPLYFSFKRANWFARSFESVLTNSVGSDENKPLVSDTSIKVTLRKSPAGSIAFIDNPDSVARAFKLSAPVGTRVKETISVKLDAGQIIPVIQGYKLTPEVTIDWSPSYIYQIIPQGKIITLVVQGKAGSLAQMFFSIRGNSVVVHDVKSFNAPQGSGHVDFKSLISATEPVMHSFKTYGCTVRIITVNDDLAKRTWVNESDSKDIVIGPEYAGEASVKNGLVNLTTEHPRLEKSSYPTWIYSPGDKLIKLPPESFASKHQTIVKPGIWHVKDASQPSQPNFDDTKWLKSQQPLQMGADGDITANAWYRTKIKVTETGNYTLQFAHAPEHGALFLDGKRIDTAEFFESSIKLNLKANINHTLAIFTSHTGRNKLIFKVGVIDTLDMKGIAGPVTLQKTGTADKQITILNWRMKGGPGNPFEAVEWKPLITNQTKVQKFYKATLNLPVQKGSKTIWRVNTTSLSYGSVWVNGHNLGRYPEKIKIWGHYIPECWLKPGKNGIVIYDENGFSPDKVKIQAEVEASRDIEILQYKTKVLQ